MGLFDWFKRKPSVDIADDVVWMTRKAKLAGIEAAVEKRLEDDDLAAIILVAHFPDSWSELQSMIETRGWDDHRIHVTAADTLTTQGIPTTERDRSRRFHLIAGERHPSRSHDSALVEVATNCPCRCRLVHHLSLEDGVMRFFGGEMVEEILKQLGMSENESIRSPMVTRRIEVAQRKIESRAGSDLPAFCAEEWFERNCPALWEQRKDATDR